MVNQLLHLAMLKKRNWNNQKKRNKQKNTKRINRANKMKLRHHHRINLKLRKIRKEEARKRRSDVFNV